MPVSVSGIEQVGGKDTCQMTRGRGVVLEKTTWLDRTDGRARMVGAQSAINDNHLIVDGEMFQRQVVDLHKRRKRKSPPQPSRMAKLRIPDWPPSRLSFSSRLSTSSPSRPRQSPRQPTNPPIMSAPISSAAAAHTASKFQSFMNHPAGPKYVVSGPSRLGLHETIHLVSSPMTAVSSRLLTV